MMIAKRKYRFSDGEMVMKAMKMIEAARRDADELAAYGFTSLKTDDLEAQWTAIVNLPTDQELAAAVKEKTALKTATKAAAIRYVMQAIMQRVELAFGVDSATYARFRIKGIREMRDGALLVALLRVHQLANRDEVKTALAPYGLTQAHVDKVSALADDFMAHWLDQLAAIESRDVAVEKRIAAGNALYAGLATLAMLGKRIWAATSEARYHNYVLYSGPARGQQVAAGVVAANAPAIAAVSGFTGATRMALRSTGGQPLRVYFATHATDPPPPGAKELPAGGQTVRYTARALGYEPGQREVLLLHNPTAQPGGYEITHPG